MVRKLGVGRNATDLCLRLLSLFVIFIVLCEFSGLSNKIVDYYGSKRFTTANIPISALSGVNDVKGYFNTSQRLSNVRIRKRTFRSKSLEDLYGGHQPQKLFGQFIKETQNPIISRAKLNFELQVHWNEKNPDRRVCTIHNACILSDESLLVHPWMRSQERLLRLCGVQKLEYMNSIAEYNISDETTNTDIFGIVPTRYHIPHFLTDILPMLYASELLQPQTLAKTEISSACETPRRERCKKTWIDRKLNAAIFGEDRIQTMTLDSWVPQLIAMLPGKPAFYSPSMLFDGDRKKRCFRSVIGYDKMRFIRNGRDWFGDNNAIFQRHGLTRRSVLTENYKRPFSPSRKSKKCNVNISILNREGWVRRGKFLTGRDISNVEEVKMMIEKMAKEEEYSKMNIKVGIEYFENKTFSEQVNIMQKADVILGVHGAGLGNLLFAREDVPILEVFPFGYYAGPFDLLSEALHLRYSHFVANPDSRSFLECLRLKAERHDDKNIIIRGEEIWKEALKRRSQVGELYYMKSHMYRGDVLSTIKLCARGQRMKVNEKEVASRLLVMAEEVCGEVTRVGE